MLVDPSSLYLYCSHFTYILLFIFFFFNDTATTEIYTLSLHDALPICSSFASLSSLFVKTNRMGMNSSSLSCTSDVTDRKSTRLNSSHLGISYAVFCLKKKKKNN